MSAEFRAEKENGSNGEKPIENRRDQKGRFQKGAKPGPGRRRKIVEVFNQGKGPLSANDLVLRAMEIRESLDAWQALVDAGRCEVLAELVAEHEFVGRFVPPFVYDAIAKANRRGGA